MRFVRPKSVSFITQEHLFSEYRIPLKGNSKKPIRLCSVYLGSQRDVT